MFTSLTTSVKGLSEQVQTIQKSNASSNNTPNENKNKGNRQQISEWRKSKTFGEEVFKDEKQYYWCPKHQDGKGLYVTHHPLDHGKQPREWSHTRKKGSEPATSGNEGDKKLQLAESMKAALTSNGFSNEKADSLLSSLKNNNGVDFW